MTRPKTTRRCAVYTRKSTDEGLDQAFNTLQAQREACEAYITSQTHEGWRLLKTAYDDGGFSGGTLDRPALTQLLDDIKRGLIDIIVVYKVDRLTRSLGDFAKIVEILDAHGGSFVSVTQSFNSTTSMGRLTLNVLLSFAQFEREVTGERIRDKIAASKRKGMWMGGFPPLGYDIGDRKLIVNEREAEQVRFIFRRYFELGSVRPLLAELMAKGLRSKTWTTEAGRQVGGSVILRGALYWMLRNRIYIGEIKHKRTAHPGNHPAIIDRSLWDNVQTKLSQNQRKPVGKIKTASKAPLMGLLYDDRNNLMTPTYTVKSNGSRYRYYVSQAVLKNRDNEVGSIPRVPAHAIETLVFDQLAARMPVEEREVFNGLGSDQRLQTLRERVDRIEIRTHDVAITFSASRDYPPSKEDATENDVDANVEEIVDTAKTIIVPVRMKLWGGEKFMNVVGQPTVDRKSQPNPGLIRALARAHAWRTLIDTGQVRTIQEIARRNDCTNSYARFMLEISFLAPEIVDAIFAGTQPQGIAVRRLLEIKISNSWRGQRAQFEMIQSQS